MHNSAFPNSRPLYRGWCCPLSTCWELGDQDLQVSSNITFSCATPTTSQSLPPGISATTRTTSEPQQTTGSRQIPRLLETAARRLSIRRRQRGRQDGVLLAVGRTLHFSPPISRRANLFLSQKEDSSPASFERTLSALSAKITTTQTQLEKVRSRSRRVKVLSTLYLGFAYLVYAIVLMLVVGWKYMGPLEWTGMAGGPVVIYLVRTISTAIFDYRINALNARLRVLQVERSKTIQKLKDATKYDSTLQLLEKYGDSENKPKGGKKKAGDEEDTDGEKKRGAAPKQGHASGRTGLPPPPTANIQRHPPSGPGTPQPQQRVQSPFGTPAQPTPRSDIDASAEFAPNAFDGRAPPAQLTQIHHAPAPMAAPEHHWYDRILDTLLGEDETAAKNRIVMICGNCRLVNGQAPPGTKSLSDLGTWKCMACGASNGELDEGKRIVQEVLGKRTAAAAEATDEEGAGDSSDLVEVDKDDIAEGNTGRDGLKVRKGKGN